jgi:hypothetical protein
LNSKGEIDPTGLFAPSALSGKATSPTSIHLRFKNNSPAATGFIIERKTTAPYDSWLELPQLPQVRAGEKVEFDDAAEGYFPVIPSTTYLYRVFAIHNGVRSLNSATVAVST